MQSKKSTEETYHERINRVVEYINNHLDGDIDLEKLAGISGFSPFHFHRITRAFLGEPIGAFIVRIRMETAARLLRHTGLSVAEIADKVGYDTPSSLSKNFRLFYHISPSDYRTDKTYTIMKPLQLSPSFRLKSPKISDFPARNVIYIRATGCYDELDFEGAWSRLWGCVKQQKLFTAGIEHIAVYYDDPKVTCAQKLRTDLCLAIHKPAAPAGEIGVRQIPGGKYAVFLYQGPYDKLGMVYDTIFSQWLPESGEKPADRSCFEKYLNNPAKTAPDKLKTEIYIPLE